MKTAAGLSPDLDREDREALDRLAAWAEEARGREDAKATRLLDWLDEVVQGDERAVVFTEYRDTQRYLQERLAARGMPASRVALLHGGLDEDEREGVKARLRGVGSRLGSACIGR
jgi:ERCC4-related helicase